MPQVTYVTYNKGIDAKHLHLGNLVHDFKDPSNLEPYIEKAYTDISEPAPTWARSSALENFALTIGEGVEDDDSEEESDNVDGKRYRVVAAGKTTQLEIDDPEDFFQNTTLKSPKAKQWLTTHISAFETLSPQSPPQIWMLTGLMLMTHATWTSLSSKQTFTPGLPAPFDPTGVTALRRSSVSEHVRPVFGYEEKEGAKNVGGSVIHETGKWPGTRGWAARWERVEVKVGGADKWKDGVDGLLKLRGGTGGERVAMVELDEGSYAQNGDPGVEGDDKYWDAFVDLVDELD